MNLGTYAHFLWHALRLRSDPSHRVPLTTNIQVTTQCTNRCRYCDYDRDRPDRLTLEKLTSLLEEIRAMGGRRVNFTGGEPLMRHDLDRIVGTAADLGFVVGVSTNGARAADQLPALKRCDRVMLSFDGPREVRAALCGARSADESEEAVRLFRDNDIPFWTTTVLTRASLPHLDWVVEHAGRNGTLANFVLFHTQPGDGPRFHPRRERVAAILPQDREVRAALRHLIEMKRAGAPIGSSLPYLELLLEWPDYGNIRSGRPSPRYHCLAGRASSEMTADGSLYACGWLRDRVPGKQVLDHGFREAFRNLPPDRDCRSCASSCWLESNLIFNLDPDTVMNWIRNLQR